MSEKTDIKSMDLEELKKYGKAMACLGYYQALGAANKLSGSSLGSLIRSTVPEISQNFGGIVHVIASLMEEEKKEATSLLN